MKRIAPFILIFAASTLMGCSSLRTTSAPRSLHRGLDQRDSEIRRLNVLLERQEGEIAVIEAYRKVDPA